MYRIYFLFIFLLGISSLSAQEIYVSQFGNDSTGNGTEQQPYKTLYKAYQSIESKTYKTLFDDCDSVYHVPIEKTFKSCRIILEDTIELGENLPRLKWSKSGSEAFPIRVVSKSGMASIKRGKGRAYGYMIELLGAEYVHFENIHFIDAPNAFYLNFANHCVIKFCYFDIPVASMGSGGVITISTSWPPKKGDAELCWKYSLDCRNKDCELMEQQMSSYNVIEGNYIHFKGHDYLKTSHIRRIEYYLKDSLVKTKVKTVNFSKDHGIYLAHAKFNQINYNTVINAPGHAIQNYHNYTQDNLYQGNIIEYCHYGDEVNQYIEVPKDYETKQGDYVLKVKHEIDVDQFDQRHAFLLGKDNRRETVTGNKVVRNYININHDVKKSKGRKGYRSSYGDGANVEDKGSHNDVLFNIHLDETNEAKETQVFYHDQKGKYAFDPYWDTSFNKMMTKSVPVVGDFSGNGYDDIALFYKENEKKISIYVIKSDGLGYYFHQPTKWGEINLDLDSFKERITTGDYDHDKDDDIVVMADNGDGTSKLELIRSSGQNFVQDIVNGLSVEFDVNTIKGSLVSGHFDRRHSGEDIVLMTGSEEKGLELWLFASNRMLHGIPKKIWSNDSMNISAVQGGIVAGDFKRNRLSKKDEIAFVYSEDGETVVLVLKQDKNTFQEDIEWEGKTSAVHYSNVRVLGGNYSTYREKDDLILLSGLDYQKSLLTIFHSSPKGANFYSTTDTIDLVSNDMEFLGAQVNGKLNSEEELICFKISPNGSVRTLVMQAKNHKFNWLNEGFGYPWLRAVDLDCSLRFFK